MTFRASSMAARSFKLLSHLPYMHAPTPLSRQISMDAKSSVSQLNGAGLLRSQGLIGGKWSDAYNGSTIKVYNPATGEVITTVPCMGQKETNDAIYSACI